MKFEWVKWKRNPKNILLLGILLLALGVQVAEQWDSSKQVNKSDHQYLKAVADEIQPPQGYVGTPEPYKMLHHLDEQGVFLSKKDQMQYEKVVNILYLLEDENTARLTGDWKERRNVQTERLLLQSEYMKAGGTEWSMLSLDEVTQQLGRNEWLKEHDLPIEDISSSPKGMYFLYSLLRHAMSSGLLLVVVALFFFDFMTSEYERRTYLFMSVQPISKQKRYFRKTGMAVLIIGAVYLLYLGLGFLSASLLFGTGSVSYPIIIEGTSAFYYISIGSYILAVIVLQLLFIAFIVQLLMLLSKAVKHSLEVLAVFLALFLVPNLLKSVLFNENSLVQWLPFFYMDVDAYLRESIGFTQAFFFGAAVLVIGNIILLRLGSKAVNRI
ncbi:ABC transporter permease subunit [Enterococcus sp. BWR-S5]|uniref:ABC transporter permease subunit n=1 Tax=Enterococcus sp. BWR-S5 TaxID=2787714 RepID=UPI00192336E5|nr:ABC transporter permease subunit [Enterococcus sp. BWR-S5]MBL1226315.1 ABC transporter permease [Enterococcus sp. BWR-S5]